jgi:hypothetical protein
MSCLGMINMIIVLGKDIELMASYHHRMVSSGDRYAVLEMLVRLLLCDPTAAEEAMLVQVRKGWGRR